MTQRGKDYYHILGVPEGASMDEIKRAYRRLARQYHPDVYKAPDAEKKFKEINEAYQTLSDPEKRAQYDYFRQPGAEVFRGFPGFGFEEAFRGFEEFGDIFNIFFGRAGPTVTRRARGQRGDDLRYDLSITLEEVSSGVEKEIEIEHLGICPKCGGSGAEPGTEPSRCSTCH